MKPATPQTTPTSLQFQIIWLVFLAGLPLYIFLIGEGWPSGENQGDLPTGSLALVLSGTVASIIVRWAILPRMKTPQAMLQTMVVGLALAETTAFLGIFFIDPEFPAVQRAAYYASFFGMFQFLPTFAIDLPCAPGRNEDDS